MDNQGLAQAATAVLSVFLPYVWHGNLPSTGDRATWETAARLWQALRPLLEADGGAALHPLERTPSRASILKAAVEQPTETSLAQLSQTLTGLFDVAPDLASQVAAILSASSFKIVLDELQDDSSRSNLARQITRLGQQIIAMRSGQPTMSASASAAGAPAPAVAPRCQVCGRSDSTLRVVSYPFVISLLFVTFRRALAGIWCDQHASLQRLMASLVTVCVGWWGIPFGLLYTPVALLTLARGGTQPPDINREMLMALAQYKLKVDNNPREALRCLEAALTFGVTPALEARLRELYALNPDVEQRRGGLPRLIAFPLLLLAVTGIGLLTGMVDNAITYLFSLLGENVPDLVALMSWVPLLAMAFGAGMLTTQLVEWALLRTNTRQRILGGVVAVFTTLTLIYAIPSGEAIFVSLFGPNASGAFSSPLTAIIRLALAVAWGGETYFESILGGISSTPDAIFLIVLLVMGVLYMIATLNAARSVGDRLRAADGLRPAPVSVSVFSGLTGWMALAGWVVLSAVLLLGSALVSDFQFGSPATMQAMNDSIAKIDDGDTEAARALLVKAQTQDPGSFLPYVGLGMVDLEEGNCDQSLKDSQAAAKLAPQRYQEMVDAYTGEAYMCMFRVDDAVAAYERAAGRSHPSRETLAKLGLLYIAIGDYDKAGTNLSKAQALDVTWAVPYASQAMLYYLTDKPDQEQQALKQALAQKIDEQNELTMMAGYYSARHDFPTAEKYLRQALALKPNYPNTMLSLAHVLSNEKKFDEAGKLVDHVLAGKSDPIEALLTSSDVLTDQEKLDDALDALRKADRLRPNDPGVQDELAWVYYFKKDYPTALSDASASVAGYKYAADAYAVQALAYQASGQQDEACTAAGQAIKLNVMFDVPHYVLAYCDLARGDKASARKELQAFLSLTWDRAYIRDLAADAQSKLASLGAQ